MQKAQDDLKVTQEKLKTEEEAVKKFDGVDPEALKKQIADLSDRDFKALLNTADATTESGFAEEHVDKAIVYMEKVPAIVSVAAKTEKNTADIDFIAMAADIEL